MQPRRPFRFEPAKGLEVLLYISFRLNFSYYRILKTLYLADRHHLQNYGRQICGDHYIAMKSGVVPSGLYDFIKDVQEPRRRPAHGIDAREAFLLEGFKIIPKRNPYMEYLSKSDIECLDRAIREMKGMNKKALYDATHGSDYQAADRDDEVPFDAFAKTLPNGDQLLKALRS